MPLLAEPKQKSKVKGVLEIVCISQSPRAESRIERGEQNPGGKQDATTEDRPSLSSLCYIQGQQWASDITWPILP